MEVTDLKLSVQEPNPKMTAAHSTWFEGADGGVPCILTAADNYLVAVLEQKV